MAEKRIIELQMKARFTKSSKPLKINGISLKMLAKRMGQ